jgi:hypothetical protein
MFCVNQYPLAGIEIDFGDRLITTITIQIDKLARHVYPRLQNCASPILRAEDVVVNFMISFYDCFVAFLLDVCFYFYRTDVR